MAIRGDSYSSADKVFALTRYLAEGEEEFTAATQPSLTEVESFIDEASGILNNAIQKQGIAPSVVYANSTAKLSCDAWVRAKAVAFVELTHPLQGFTGTEETAAGLLDGLYDDADKFAMKRALGWKRLGLTVADPSNQGLGFTADTLQEKRSDPDNTSREQPKFKRNLWDYS